MEKIELFIGRCLAAAVSFYCFFKPSVLLSSIDGSGFDYGGGLLTVRVLLLIFGMYNILELCKEITPAKRK